MANTIAGPDPARYHQHPDYLAAAAEAQKARLEHSEARNVAADLESQRDSYLQEQARLQRDGRPIITNDEAHASGGTVAGFAIQYRPEVTTAQIAATYDRAAELDKVATALEAKASKLKGRTYDAIGEARRHGHRYIVGQEMTLNGLRLQQGQAVPTEALDALTHSKRNALLVSGRIVPLP